MRLAAPAVGATLAARCRGICRSDARRRRCDDIVDAKQAEEAAEEPSRTRRLDDRCRNGLHRSRRRRRRRGRWWGDGPDDRLLRTLGAHRLGLSNLGLVIARNVRQFVARDARFRVGQIIANALYFVVRGF